VVVVRGIFSKVRPRVVVVRGGFSKVRPRVVVVGELFSSRLLPPQPPIFTLYCTIYIPSPKGVRKATAEAPEPAVRHCLPVFHPAGRVGLSRASGDAVTCATLALTWTRALMPLLHLRTWSPTTDRTGGRPTGRNPTHAGNSGCLTKCTTSRAGACGSPPVVNRHLGT
jgi:hypothetical protein